MAPTPTKSRLWRSFVASSTTKKQSVAHASSGALPREWPATPDAYELLGQIGKGAAAVVYRARCKPFDAIVAVRKLNLDAGGTTDLAGLVREATIMRCYNHPAVLPLHAAFVASRELWMVTPLMGQGSVRSIMVRHFPQGLEEVVIASIMKVVLLGLSYVHKQGGIHRDIKADNILISEAGQVCLGDFGVSASSSSLHCATSIGSATDLRAHTFVGTPCWMAPEVIQQLDGGYGCEADVWSVGITMLELAHGQPPMAKMHPMRVVMGTLHNPPPALEDHPTGRKFSKALHAVVDACLNKDPHQRPTAAELLHYKFFRSAKGSAFLAHHFLAGLPLPEATRVATSARLRRAASNKLKDLLTSNPFGSGRHLSAWFFPPLDVPEEEEQQQQQQQQQQDDTRVHAHSDQQAATKQDAADGVPALVAAAAGLTTNDEHGAWQEPPAPLQLEQPMSQEQQQQQEFASPFEAAAQQPPHLLEDNQQSQAALPVVNLLQDSGSPFRAAGSSERHHKHLLPAWLSGMGSGGGVGSSGSASSGGGRRRSSNPIAAALQAFVRARHQRRATADADVAVFAAQPRIAAVHSS